MVTRMCALHVEEIRKSLPSIYLARGRFPENGAKNIKIFNIKVIIAEN